MHKYIIYPGYTLIIKIFHCLYPHFPCSYISVSLETQYVNIAIHIDIHSNQYKWNITEAIGENRVNL